MQGRAGQDRTGQDRQRDRKILLLEVVQITAKLYNTSQVEIESTIWSNITVSSFDVFCNVRSHDCHKPHNTMYSKRGDLTKP